MDIYTFYTPSHKFYIDDWFMKTISDEEKESVHIEEFPQECSSGDFMSDGWGDSMKRKVNYIRDCISTTDKHFHMDSDIQFFRPFVDDYNKIMDEHDLDILAQNDGNRTICCGCMLIKSNEKTKNLFDEVYENLKKGEFGGNDQHICNKLVRQKKNLRVGLLGLDAYSVWMSNGGTRWEIGQDISNIPDDIRLHHANYTVGEENKVKLLEAVRNKYDAKMQVCGE